MLSFTKNIYHLKKSCLKNEGNMAFEYQLLLFLQQQKTYRYLATYSSTRNRKFKRLEPHFQFSATRSASKEGTEMLSLCHSHGNARLKEPSTALPIVDEWEKSKLEQNYGTSYRKNER